MKAVILTLLFFTAAVIAKFDLECLPNQKYEYGVTGQPCKVDPNGHIVRLFAEEAIAIYNQQQLSNKGSDYVVVKVLHAEQQPNAGFNLVIYFTATKDYDRFIGCHAQEYISAEDKYGKPINPYEVKVDCSPLLD